MPSQWHFWLYPDLRKFEATEQDAALRDARSVSFDAIELAGIGAAIAVTVVITRYSTVGMGLGEGIGSGLANAVVAFVLLLILAGPFYIRRVRRGLSAQLNRRRHD
ncbi:MAG: hypothetical protein IT518_05715 [Burkholderiales bacterium]|nr:hypothetical protein [Burkholderiales bacterium]